MVKITDYFRSGWAFLVPYVFAYLIYAALKWPVNHASGTIPSLFTVYWGIHIIHVLLGGSSLINAWKNRDADHRFTDYLYSALPWLCLALIFWIPGVYMEFPADPWQHFARVNEWRWHELVVQHSEWKKSSYFLGYSFFGEVAPPLRQLKAFDLYYTGCCLLLCWQYYRLALALGLSRKVSFLFVVVQTLTFGNNIFGFYRYYGMSSTVFSQLGAVALTRIAIQIAAHPNFSLKRLFNCRRILIQPRSDTTSPTTDTALGETFPCAIKTGSITLCLLIATAFNHTQGVGIAAIGVSAVVTWRLIAWRSSMIFWLFGLVIIGSVIVILWYPRHHFIDTVYRPRGWLAPWYGFNLYQPSSPSFQRAWVITGALGCVNIIAGIWLIYKNQLVGWLTLMPVILLSLPFFAIPFCNALGPSHSFPEGYIIVFHRMLFAIPTGLALVAILKNTISQNSLQIKYTDGFGCAIAALAFSILVPIRGPWSFNRVYNTFFRPSSDLSANPLIKAFPAFSEKSPRFISTHGISYVATAVGSRAEWYSQKWMPKGRSETVSWSIIEFQQTAAKNKPALFMVPYEFDLFSSGSFIAFFSQHWNPHQFAIEYLRGPQINHLLKATPTQRVETESKATFFAAPPEN